VVSKVCLFKGRGKMPAEHLLISNGRGRLLCV
jgi:hypothetical protein